MRINNKILQIGIKDIVLQYFLFRWLFIILYFFAIIALLRYSYFIGVFEISYFYDPLWLQYCFEYWRTNPIYLLSIGVFILIILFGIGWKNIFVETFQYLYIPLIFSVNHKKAFYISYNYIAPFVIIIFLSYNVFPAIHLAHNIALLLFLIQALSIGLIILRFLHPMIREYLKAKKPLSKHSHSVISYNTSSLGILSEETKNEQKIYEAVEKKQTNHHALITGEKSFSNLSYKGFKSVFTELSRLVDGDQIIGSFHNNISLHSKTTTAFRHIMNLISKHNKIEIVHADTDYGSIIEAINNFKSNSNIHEIKLKDKIFEDGFSLVEINERYKKMVKNIKPSKQTYLVIVITHVLSESGITIQDLPKLIEELKDINKDIITIIDGAQALGNIYVDKSVLEKCDFYVSCGHKWLSGSKTRGIAFYNPNSNIFKEIDTLDLFEKSRSFSYYDYDTTQRSDETVSLHPDITLVSSLKNFNSIDGGMKAVEEHNSLLANTFRSEIYGKKYVKLIPPKTKGGIVTILVEKKYKISEGLLKYNIDFEEYNEGNKLRFSFHFYMGIKHVNKLVFILDQITNDQSSR